MAVRNTYKQFLAGKQNAKNVGTIQFPMRSPKAPVFAIPELNPDPTTPRGWRRRNGKKK